MIKNEYKVVGYERLAEEYYDEDKHPTCANFRQASKRLIWSFLDEWGEKKSILEVGAGDSLVGEYIQTFSTENIKAVISDSSPEMLKYSRKYEPLIETKVLDVFKMPFKNESFDIIISSLGDPYNEKSFWDECYRVLKKNGVCVFTTPSLHWSTKFRNKTKHPENLAEFELKDGQIVNVKSIILDKESQLSLVNRDSFSLIRYEGITTNQLNESSISEKLKISDADQEIVTVYVFRKK